MPTELEQVQAIVGGAQAAADEAGLAGQHLGAARIQAVIQLARVLWARLNPPAPAAEPPAPPPNGEPPKPRLEAVD